MREKIKCQRNQLSHVVARIVQSLQYKGFVISIERRIIENMISGVVQRSGEGMIAGGEKHGCIFCGVIQYVGGVKRRGI